jgi:hypothetical protein
MGAAAAQRDSLSRLGLAGRRVVEARYSWRSYRYGNESGSIRTGLREVAVFFP